MTQKEFANKIEKINRQVYEMFQKIDNVEGITPEQLNEDSRLLDKVFVTLCLVAHDFGAR